MKETLIDIRTRIGNKEYLNEEQIRFSLIGRILFKLGWNIWNPKEVVTEFKANPRDDVKKVDVALIMNPHQPPSVFMEIKSIGMLGNSQILSSAEVQLRDYNKNHTAMFSIITDGLQIRFYYSQTGGEFDEKCFCVLNIIDDNLDQLEEQLCLFLSKESHNDGSAEQKAKSFLNLSKMQRIMNTSLLEAQKRTNENPYPSLPDALLTVVQELGFIIKPEEIMDFLDKQTKSPVLPLKPTQGTLVTPTIISEISNKTGAELFLSIGRVSAKGLLTNRKMKVYSGSFAKLDDSKSIPKAAKSEKELLIKKGILVSDGNAFKFSSDYEFESANVAVGVISGSSLNARDYWKDKNGRSINDLNLST